jgi:NADPH-ferrihemoprotein reductase
MTADLSDYDAETIALIPATNLTIFILSTFGEGDPSDNAVAFWEWIEKADVSLSNLHYMAFGLGNRNYKYYNRVVNVVSAGLNKLGAKSLMPVGKADDATSATKEDFMTWRDELFLFFRQELHFEEGVMKYEPTLSVIE